MDESKIVQLRDFFAALSNVKRLQIVLLCGKRGLTVTELSKKLKLTYTMTSEYVNLLARQGLVSRTRNPDRTVTVRASVRLLENGEVSRL